MQHRDRPSRQRIRFLPLVREGRHAAGAELDEGGRQAPRSALPPAHCAAAARRVPPGRTACTPSMASRSRADTGRRTLIPMPTTTYAGPAASLRKSIRMPPSLRSLLDDVVRPLECEPADAEPAKRAQGRRRQRRATARQASRAHPDSSSSPTGRAPRQRAPPSAARAGRGRHSGTPRGRRRSVRAAGRRRRAGNRSSRRGSRAPRDDAACRAQPVAGGADAGRVEQVDRRFEAIAAARQRLEGNAPLRELLQPLPDRRTGHGKCRRQFLAGMQCTVRHQPEQFDASAHPRGATRPEQPEFLRAAARCRT